MHASLREFLTVRGTAYFVVDVRGIVREISPEIQRFAANRRAPEPGTDATIAFPELAEATADLRAVLDGRRDRWTGRAVREASPEEQRAGTGSQPLAIALEATRLAPDPADRGDAAAEVAAAEVAATNEVATDEIDAAEVDAAEVATDEIDAAEVDAAEIDGPQAQLLVTAVPLAVPPATVAPPSPAPEAIADAPARRSPDRATPEPSGDREAPPEEQRALVPPAIANAMADPTLIVRKDGTIEFLNPAAEALFGYAAADLLGQTIDRAIADPHYMMTVLHDYVLAQQEGVKDIEVICRTRAGDAKTLSFSCSSLRETPDGQPRILYVGRDVTDRQAAQQRLVAQYIATRALSNADTLDSASLKLLQSLCQTLTWQVGELWLAETAHQPLPYLGQGSALPLLRRSAVWTAPSKELARFAAASDALDCQAGQGFVGYTWSQRSPQWCANVLEDERFERWALAGPAGLRSALAIPIGSSAQTFGVLMLLGQHVRHPDEEMLQTLQVIGEQVGQFLQRKQAEAALQESEARYRDLFESATDLIQATTPDGSFLYVNRAWRETLGYGDRDLDSLTLNDIVSPDSRPEVLQTFHRVLSSQKPAKLRADFLTCDGRKVVVDGHLSCKLANGIPVATRAILRDVTQQVAAELALRYQQEQSERLLLNVLPARIAAQLKQERATIAEKFSDATVMFADIVGFTRIASHLSPIELIDLLNHLFSAFDRLTELHGLEKIKTIGDAYMVVGGLPKRRADHARAIARMALDMQEAICEFNVQHHQAFSMRIGIHSGPVVAGVIGIKKFIYDLWGDTVNVASRMESQGSAGRIQVSETTYRQLRYEFELERRGTLQVRGWGQMNTYWLLGRAGEVMREEVEVAGAALGQLLHSPRRRTARKLVGRIDDRLRQTESTPLAPGQPSPCNPRREGTDGDRPEVGNGPGPRSPDEGPRESPGETLREREES